LTIVVFGFWVSRIRSSPANTVVTIGVQLICSAFSLTSPITRFSNRSKIFITSPLSISHYKRCNICDISPECSPRGNLHLEIAIFPESGVLCRSETLNPFSGINIPTTTFSSLRTQYRGYFFSKRQILRANVNITTKTKGLCKNVSLTQTLRCLSHRGLLM